MPRRRPGTLRDHPDEHRRHGSADLCFWAAQCHRPRPCTRSPANCGLPTPGTTARAGTRPPEWITPLRDGGFYGWPFAYGDQVWTDFSIRSYGRSIFPLTRCRFAVSCQYGDLQPSSFPPTWHPWRCISTTRDQFPPSVQTRRVCRLPRGRLGQRSGLQGHGALCRTRRLQRPRRRFSHRLPARL